MVSASASSDSSVTTTAPERDIESQKMVKSHTHNWQLVLHPAGLTQEVLERKYQGHGTAESPFIVDFLPEDAHNPMIFPKWKKWSITVLQAWATLAVAFVSTAYSGGISQVLADFKIDSEIAILGISLFVVGFAVGPLAWAPLSEMYGRQRLFFITYMFLTAFNVGAALSPNIQSLIIFRFLAGAFGSSPLTNSGGVIADMFPASERGLATAVFATAPFLGPSIGPIVGGFLGEAKGWRWVEWLMTIFTGTLWLLCSSLVPETYTPVLLRMRADKLSKLTGRVYVSKLDAGKPKKSLKHQFKVALSRPWILLFREPIVFLSAIYLAIIYGTMYLQFAAFPIVFQQQRGWSPGIGGLAFVGLAVGMTLAVFYAMYDNARYAKVVEKSGGHAAPEARLPPSLIGSVLLPIGLFWFAWTNGPSVHWVVPIIGSGVFGAGMVMVFLSTFNYLIDSYVIFAASVLAANAVLRSLFGAAFPLFTTYMYRNLGIHWASSIPAFLALACVPFPFIAYRYGEQVRLRCKYSNEAAQVLERMRTRHEEVDEDAAEQEVEETERLEREERRRSHSLARKSSERRRSLSFGLKRGEGEPSAEKKEEGGVLGG